MNLSLLNRHRTRENHVTHQQTVGPVYGYAAGETMMDGQVLHISRWVVASSLIHISIHVEMNRVVTHRLLSHVQELHPLDVHCFKTMLHLKWRQKLNYEISNVPTT